MILARLDLNLLLAFEALERTRNVTRAAEMLGLRQPAMSAALARLRAAFDDPLFVRAAGAMQPTPKAARLTPGVIDALGRLREALSEDAPFLAADARRCFTLAATDYGALTIGPPLMAAVAAQAPGVDIRIIGYDKDDVPALIDRGQIDLAIGVFQTAPGRVIRQFLARERFMGVARRDHPGLVQGRMSLPAFVACQHALVSVRRDERGVIDAALARQGLSRRVALVLPHMLVVPRVLAACDLIAALPERVARLCEAEGLAVFDLPIETPDWRIEMLWNAGARNDPASAWLRARVVETVAAR